MSGIIAMIYCYMNHSYVNWCVKIMSGIIT